MPRLTASLAGLSVLIQALPGAREWLAYDRAPVFSGQLWRLMSGHLCHASSGHLLWNLAAFCILGAWLEHAHRRAYRLLLPLSALGIGMVLMALPQVVVYVGLSGVNSALTAFLIAGMLYASRGWRRFAATGLFALLALKLAYEWQTGTFLFVSLEPGWTPLPAAHLSGGAIGLLAAVVASLPRPGTTLDRRPAVTHLTGMSTTAKATTPPWGDAPPSAPNPD
jgi:rhomboid family GlyGly-CTERM serine protease